MQVKRERGRIEERRKKGLKEERDEKGHVGEIQTKLKKEIKKVTRKWKKMNDK